ncbi:MAG: hypothetical protein ACI9LA_000791 [Bacteroidia bacterium]|jgi:hypothetical protein
MKKLAFILGTVVLFSACGETASTESENIDSAVVENPATADNAEGINQDVAVPAFTFEKEAHDFGAIIQGEKVSYSFKFKNTGEGDLIITSAKGSCGCTIPEYPTDPLAPGQEGVIDVVFNSDGKSGQQNKKVTIVANTVPNTTVLAINGMVEVPVSE